MYANEENAGSSIFWLPFYGKVICMGDIYSKFSAYINCIFCKRAYETLAMVLDVTSSIMNYNCMNINDDYANEMFQKY